MRKPEIAPLRVEEYLRERFGAVEGFERLVEGDESQAFAFLGEGEALICRVNKFRRGFDKDDFAYRHFSSSTLPVPEILSTEPLDAAWLCISVRAPGRTLQSLSARAADYAEPLARTMDALASTDISMLSGFGEFEANGQGEFAHWRDYLAAIDDPTLFDWSAVSDIVPPDAVKPFLEIVQQLAPKCPDIAQLVHGDFGSNNVLVAQRAITSVIDWSEAMRGDPLYDVANIVFWRSWLDCMETQAAYFERHADPRLRDSERLICYQLRIGLQAMHDAAMDGNAGFVGWALERLGAIAVR